MHQNNVIGRRPHRVQRILHRLLTMLAAHHQLDFLILQTRINPRKLEMRRVRLLPQLFAHAVNLIFAQRNPYLAHRIDRRKLAQRV